jgi:hypothetical protein
MKTTARVALMFLSTLLGLALCIAVIRVDEALHLLPRLPTPGGEDDFTVRAALFFGIACPALAALGGYLGWIGAVGWRRALRGWAGVLLGAVACFGAVGAFPSLLLAAARTPLGGNGAFALFLTVWVLLSVWLAWWIGRRGVSGRE